MRTRVGRDLLQGAFGNIFQEKKSGVCVENEDESISYPELLQHTRKWDHVYMGVFLA